MPTRYFSFLSDIISFYATLNNSREIRDCSVSNKKHYRGTTGEGAYPEGAFSRVLRHSRLPQYMGNEGAHAYNMCVGNVHV